MKLLVWLGLVATALVQVPGAVQARIPHHRGYDHAQHEHAYTGGTYGDGYYTAVSGHRVHRPMQANNQPSGATAHCRDGSWSFSENHRGTCSHHGGVADWL